MSRRWVQKLVARYAAEGETAFEPRGPGGRGWVALERELAGLGGRLRHARPYHPQTCGKVERSHQTPVEFMTVRLGENQRRIGKRLTGRVAGLYSARVQDYRIRYRIDERTRTVVVVHVAPRADAYRSD